MFYSIIREAKDHMVMFLRVHRQVLLRIGVDSNVQT